MFYKLSGTDGAILDSFDARDFGCGGYGGLVDGNGILWSIGWGWAQGILLRYDPVAGTGMCVDTRGGYGLGIDTNGYVWASIWNNGIAKVSPDGVLQPGFPKSTWPTSSTTTGSISPLMVESRLVLPALFAMQADSADPWFYVDPDRNWIGAWDGTWPADAAISFSIDTDSDPTNGVLYEGATTASSAGSLAINLESRFDIQRGQVVTVWDASTTKTHTITNLTISGFDLDLDTVFGTADL